jgi:hypothetical protein
VKYHVLYLVKSNENELKYVDLRKKKWQIEWEMIQYLFVQFNYETYK